MNIKYFLYVLAVVFALSIISNIAHYFNPPKPIVTVNTRTITKIDTVIQTKYITVTKLQAKIDTVIIDNKPIEVASADTLINKGIDSVHVKYYFPPANYFDVKLSLHDRIINHTDSIYVNTNTIIPAKTSFFSNFNYSLQIGVGVGLISKQFDVYYGLGISYRLGSIF